MTWRETAGTTGTWRPCVKQQGPSPSSLMQTLVRWSSFVKLLSGAVVLWRVSSSTILSSRQHSSWWPHRWTDQGHAEERTPAVHRNMVGTCPLLWYCTFMTHAEGVPFLSPGTACVLQPLTCGSPSSSKKLKFDFCECIESFNWCLLCVVLIEDVKFLENGN